MTLSSVHDGPLRRRLRHARALGDRPRGDRPPRRRAALLLACGLAAVVLPAQQTAAVDTSEPNAMADATPSPALAFAQRRSLPELIGAGPKVKQMITVSSPSFDSTTGTLRLGGAITKGNGCWLVGRSLWCSATTAG